MDKSSVWTIGLLLKLQPLVQTGCGKNDASGLTASRVPGNIILANRLFEVEKELTNLKTVVDNSSVSVVNHVTSLMDAMPYKVTAKILENCLIDGAVPLTTEDMQAIFGDSDNTLHALLGEATKDRCMNASYSAGFYLSQVSFFDCFN